ncbi:MAG: PspA/IM30 family protein [Gammaproteobacteria bacterium]|nr:PspA/IM30 family protein [Gammaproteobacteria bacterium]MBU2225765.1 PspA/IM30 family protein [Gammaproteobacteria bacterium]MBU2280739.1 PspA/IM30 family protein [Gammaproteobacteria bacterium]MBU2425631.1 PspA/IM30 family protein [Gammaproteobacteria bacterium]
MSESISRRVARLVSGSLNALVDAVENSAPDTVMTQAIKEIDSAIADSRSELGQQIAQKHLASKRLIDENNRHEHLTAQLEIAVQNGRDDLAAVGIAEQMDIEARIPVLEASISDCNNREKELEGFIQALQAKKRDMLAELKAFRDAQQAKEATANNPHQGSSTEQKVQHANDVFERVLENHSGVPGRGLDTSNARQLAELEELSRNNRIAERLAALKAGKA